MNLGTIQRDPSWLDQVYDVVVIGAGITGVNVARELAGRGASVLLVDKQDFGEGTSSATTKLIHGGIRYLETYEFAVVRESLRERRLLTLAAPHLVSQRRFVMPAWRWSKPPTALIGAGVGLYSALGFDRNRNVPDPLRMPLPRWWSRRRLLDEVPWLDPQGLQGAFVYHDTLNIHPERLLLALLQSAVATGARAMNHVEATGFTVRRDASGVTVTGVELHDHLSGREHRVSANAVVNAGGPWMDLVLDRLGLPLGVGVRRSKGVHLLCRPIGGVEHGDNTVFARARSGKHVIVSPWQGFHFIGPTDTAIDVAPDAVRAVEADVAEILETVNATIGESTPPLRRNDVEDVTVGIRPLIVEQGKDSYATSRRHELYDHGPAGVRQLWSIGGGKWTTGRALGQETADAVLGGSNRRRPGSGDYDSRRQGVVSGFGWAVDPEPFLAEAETTLAHVAVDAATRRYLARLYGAGFRGVLELVAADARLGARVSNVAGRLDILAQVVVAVVDEGARTLSDIVDRRLVLGTIGAVSEAELHAVAEVAGPLLGWSADQAGAAVRAEIDRRAVRRATWAGATAE